MGQDLSAEEQTQSSFRRDTISCWQPVRTTFRPQPQRIKPDTLKLSQEEKGCPRESSFLLAPPEEPSETLCIDEACPWKQIHQTDECGIRTFLLKQKIPFFDTAHFRYEMGEHYYGTLRGIFYRKPHFLIVTGDGSILIIAPININEVRVQKVSRLASISGISNNLIDCPNQCFLLYFYQCRRSEASESDEAEELRSFCVLKVSTSQQRFRDINLDKSEITDVSEMIFINCLLEDNKNKPILSVHDALTTNTHSIFMTALNTRGFRDPCPTHFPCQSSSPSEAIKSRSLSFSSSSMSSSPSSSASSPSS